MHHQSPRQKSRQILWVEDPLTSTSPADAETDAKRPSSERSQGLKDAYAAPSQERTKQPIGSRGSLPPRRHGAQEAQHSESWLRGTESSDRERRVCSLVRPACPWPPSQAWPSSHLRSRETLSCSPRRPERLRWRLVDRQGSTTPGPGPRGRCRPLPREPAGTTSGERRRPTAQQQPADPACPAGLAGFGSQPDTEDGRRGESTGYYLDHQWSVTRVLTLPLCRKECLQRQSSETSIY